uniref:Uncharacterized protein n=1 Tax=Myoviridae sp. ctuev19 TaxID=2827716 RepID=A0A8S5SFL6_9CAUD|nr:MAG TPA: hypothetical protein [Myoviridae sp. ctuev19]
MYPAPMNGHPGEKRGRRGVVYVLQNIFLPNTE